ncbi:MAG: hypothetical protein JW749_01545 [Sedimentisphaerales bacterium]|nr:hypothetical protein [Sedimentisphaerales bacterium]
MSTSQPAARMEKSAKSTLPLRSISQLLHHCQAMQEFSNVPTKVYNMSVDGTHAYYVGKSRILVHNKPPP